MKKLNMLWMVLMAMGLTITGCKSNAAKADTSNDSTAVEEAQQDNDTLAVDSVVYKAEQDSTLSSIVKADYPTGSDSMAMAVCGFIGKTLAKNYLPYSDDEASSKQYPLYKGDASKGQAIVDYYGKGTMKYLKEQYATMTEGMEENDYKPMLNNEIDIRKTGENDRYVTYNVFAYTYLAGAHGSTLDYSVNISKATKKVLEATIDAKKVKELQPILRKGIVSYIGEHDKEITEKNLHEYLIIEGNTIPLPAHAPFLAKDGVHFQYQQYEIGPYAMGIIEFTVPYSQIKPYLTPEAAKLAE